MKHLKNLMLSRPFFDRIPDQGLVLGGMGNSETLVRATRDRAGTYAFIYFASPTTVRIDCGRPSVAWWFDPRTGTAQGGDITESREFTPPGPEDWVLVLDDPMANYPPPGSVPAEPNSLPFLIQSYSDGSDSFL